MPIAGIIAEYNPFHNGHAYQLRRVRALGFERTVVILSGAFVQRGEPAVCDKRARVEAALRGGADLVLELPLRGVLSSAQGFAQSAVEVLCATGVVTDLCFGSECGDTKRLESVAQALCHPDFDAALVAELAKGVSYPVARQAALARFCADAPLLKNPNDLLGIEYILAAKGRLKAHAIARIGAAHDSTEDGSFGATRCRELLKNGESLEGLVPDFAPVENAVFVSDMERAMLARLRRLDAAYFAKIPDVSEGLENKLASAVREGCSLDEIVDAVKSKRYTRSRICRILMRAYLDVTSPAGSPEYIRILGFRKTSSDLLRHMRERATLPIVQHPAVDGKGFVTLAEEMTANDMRAVFAQTVSAAGSDYREFPVVIE